MYLLQVLSCLKETHIRLCLTWTQNSSNLYEYNQLSLSLFLGQIPDIMNQYKHRLAHKSLKMAEVGDNEPVIRIPEDFQGF